MTVAARIGLVVSVMACSGLGASPEPCSILCSAGGSCPEGMFCSSDGHCLSDPAEDCAEAPSPVPALENPLTDNECGQCDQPPTTCVSPCESQAYDPVGECVEGECVYEPVVVVPCPYGCDAETGACRPEGSAACGGTACEAESACGGVCHEGSGCTPADPAELWFDGASNLYWTPSLDAVYGVIRVCNYGTGDAAAFWIDFWVNAPSPSCGEHGDDTIRIPGLAPGQCSAVWTTRAIYVGPVIYSRTARVFADSSCEVSEGDDENVWSVSYQ